MGVDAPVSSRPEPQGSTAAPVSLRILATLVGIGVPVASAFGVIALVGPWLPERLRVRVPLALAMVFPVAMAATAVGERAWRHRRLGGSGPIDYLPAKWPRTHCRKCKYASLAEELSMALPLPIGAVLHGAVDISETGGRRHAGGREHSKRASRFMKHAGGKIAPPGGSGAPGAGSIGSGGSVQAAGGITSGGGLPGAGGGESIRGVLGRAVDGVRNARDGLLHYSHVTTLVLGPATALVLTIAVTTSGILGEARTLATRRPTVRVLPSKILPPTPPDSVPPPDGSAPVTRTRENRGTTTDIIAQPDPGQSTNTTTTDPDETQPPPPDPCRLADIPVPDLPVVGCVVDRLPLVGA